MPWLSIYTGDNPLTRARGLCKRKDGEIVVKRLPYGRSSLSGSRTLCKAFDYII